jgi:hypothetical protein
MFNWERTREWSDFQNAKFISVVNGKGEFYINDIAEARRFTDCKIDMLHKRIKRMTSGTYTYPLQKWSGSYKLFERSKIEIPRRKTLMKNIGIFLTKDAHTEDGSVERKMVIKHLRMHSKNTMSTNISRSVNNSDIWTTLHGAAQSFVAKNRPIELELFNLLYSSKLPRDCFINLYDIGTKSGLLAHRDHVSFCTVVLCLSGNGDGNLVLIDETTLPITISLHSDEMIVFARIEHSVKIKIRFEERITINAFF